MYKIYFKKIIPYTIATVLTFILSSPSTEGACSKNDQDFLTPKQKKVIRLLDVNLSKKDLSNVETLQHLGESVYFSFLSKVAFGEEKLMTQKFTKLKRQLTTSQKNIAKKIDDILDDPGIENKGEKIETIIKKKNSKNKKKRSKQDQNSHQKLAKYAFYAACEHKNPDIRTVHNLWESVEELLSDDERENVFHEGITYCISNRYGTEDSNILAHWRHNCEIFFWLQKLLRHHNHHLALKGMLLNIAKEQCHDSTESLPAENLKQFMPALYEQIMLVYTSNELIESNKIFKILANKCVYGTCLSKLLIYCITTPDLFHFQILIKAPMTDVLKPSSKIAKGLVPIFVAVSNKKMFRLALCNAKARGYGLKRVLPTLKDSDDHTLLQLAIEKDKFTITYGLVKKYGFQRKEALPILRDHIFNQYKKAISHSDENNFQSLTENDYPNTIKAHLFVGNQLTKLTKSCIHCGKTAHTKQCCKKCQAVYYCSQKCQKQHWPIHKEKIWIHKKSGLPLINYPGSGYSFVEGLSFLPAPSYSIANKMAGIIRNYTLPAEEIEQKGPQLKQIIFTNLFEQIASPDEKKQRKYLKKMGFVPVAFCVALQKLFAQGRQHCIKG